MPSSLPPFFAELTFDMLAQWAGEAVFQRGLAYHKAGKVHRLALTPQGALLATVEGTRSYVTLLFQEKGGTLASECTCLYGARCKHAVAVACAALRFLDANTPIPLVAADDRRLLMATSPDGTPWVAPGPSPEALETKLKKFSKKQLIALLTQAASLAPEIAALCLREEKLEQKDAFALVKEVHKAMHQALEAPDWDDPHSPYADYASVRTRLEALRLAGFPEEVLQLGFELKEEGQNAIEVCDDEGETLEGIAQCMEVVSRALGEVEWPVPQKLLWAADALLEDDFGVCDCFWAIWGEKHSPETWSVVADTLSGRLAQQHESLAIVAAKVPQAVFCLLTALQFHELTTQLPRQVWIAMPRGSHVPRMEYPPIKCANHLSFHEGRPMKKTKSSGAFPLGGLGTFLRHRSK